MRYWWNGEVVTEVKTFEECRELLQNALYEMVMVYCQQGKEIPAEGVRPA